MCGCVGVRVSGCAGVSVCGSLLFGGGGDFGTFDNYYIAFSYISSLFSTYINCSMGVSFIIHYPFKEHINKITTSSKIIMGMLIRIFSISDKEP